MARGLELTHVELKRDTWLQPERKIGTDKQAIEVVKDLIKDLDREMMVCINMSTAGRVINASVCSVGTMDMSLVSPPEIMRSAILSGARSIILMHNHPSGIATPSKDDDLVTKRMATVGDLMGVKLLDSIIIGGDDQRYSFLSEKPEMLEAARWTLTADTAAEAQPEYYAEEEKADIEKSISVNFVTEHRKKVVDKMIDLITEGKTFYDPMWSSAAMRPQNPISGAIYHGSNRFILMQESVIRQYKDPRWMTFKQLSSKGYRVKAGEHGTKLEKWIFTEKRKKLGSDEKPIKDSKGRFVYEEVLLKRPKCNLFYVFNGEQVQDFPKYEQEPLLQGEIGERIEALITSSNCPIHEVAQGQSYYKPGTDEIFLPLRSAFRDQNAFAEVAAHEMVHSTGHPTRLAREYGHRDIFGAPDDKYCMEELKAELGSVFLMNDIGIPVTPKEMESSAAYLDSYIRGLKENPNVLFKIMADADKASDFLFDRFQKVYELDRKVELVEENPKQTEQKAYEKEAQMAGYSL